MKSFILMLFVLSGTVLSQSAKAQDDYDPKRNQQTETSTSTTTEIPTTASSDEPKPQEPAPSDTNAPSLPVR